MWSMMCSSMRSLRAAMVPVVLSLKWRAMPWSLALLMEQYDFVKRVAMVGRQQQGQRGVRRQYYKECRV